MQIIYTGENSYFLSFFFSGSNGFVFGSSSKFSSEAMMMSYRPSLNWLTIWHLKNMDRCYSNPSPNVITKAKKTTGPKVFNRFLSNYITWNVLTILKKMFVWPFTTLCLNFEEVGRERIFFIKFCQKLANISAYWNSFL